MSKLWSVLLLLLATACSPSQQNHRVTPTPYAPQIINGVQLGAADPGAPSTVGILSTDDLKLDPNGQVAGIGQKRVLCTGTLISSDIVITAAHCQTADLKYQVIIFARDITSSSVDELRVVSQSLVEPTWDSVQSGLTAPAQGVDLAILRFNGGVPNGYFPVSIFQGASVPVGTSVLALGYGVLNPTQAATAGLLRATRLLVIAPPTQTRTTMVGGAQFSDPLPSSLRADQFNLPSATSGICFGDTGGPIYVAVSASEVSLLGISSGSYASNIPQSTKNQCRMFSTHTYVQPHQEWIAQSIVKMRNDPHFSANLNLPSL